MGEAGQENYYRDGYALVEGAAPGIVARKLLGFLHRDLTQNPGVLKNFLSQSPITKKPSYEFYGYRHPTVWGFHWGLTSRMATLTGKRLAPTYAYFRVYSKDDLCIVHSDRESCEHSFSMALGYSDDVIWPFEIDDTGRDFQTARAMAPANDFGDASPRTVMLNPGDAILYQGCAYRHGRTTPNPNRWSAHLFLHWVDLDGPFADFAFDKQNMPDPGDFEFPG